MRPTLVSEQVSRRGELWYKASPNSWKELLLQVESKHRQSASVRTVQVLLVQRPQKPRYKTPIESKAARFGYSSGEFNVYKSLCSKSTTKTMPTTTSALEQRVHLQVN